MEGPLPLDAFDMDVGAVRSRFDGAVRSGNPAWLWPNVAIDEWQHALARIETVTRQILTRGRAAERLTGPAVTVGIAGFTSGMGPLLGYWLSEGRLDAEPHVGAVLDLHFRHNAERMERMAERAVDAVSALARHGVPVLVLKGMQTAFTCFPTPGARPLSDIDLAIDPRDYPRAVAALRGLGLVPGPLSCGTPEQQTWRSPSAPTEPRCLALCHRENPWSIDLQTSLDREYPSASHLVRLDGLWTDRTTEAWALSPTGRALAPPAQALHLACHASCGFINLSMLRLCELALLIRGDVHGSRFDWHEFMHHARRLAALPSAYPALAMTELLAPGSVPERVLQAARNGLPAGVLRVVGRLSPATVQQLQSCSLEERYMWMPSRWHVVRATVRDLALPATSLAANTSIQKKRLFRVARRTLRWFDQGLC